MYARFEGGRDKSFEILHVVFDNHSLLELFNKKCVCVRVHTRARVCVV